MRPEHLPNVDLNLLRLLDTLLEVGSVTRAAKLVHLSQPAASRALSRLRDQLGDQLLVLQGRRMVPTPFAQRLRIPLRQHLTDLDRLLWDRHTFDPRTTKRRFIVGTRDSTLLVLSPALRRAFQVQAPSAELVICPSRGRFGAALETDNFDLVLEPYPTGLEWVSREPLLTSTWAVASRPQAGSAKRLTLKRYLSEPHVLVSPDGNGPGLVDGVLARTGRERRIAMRVPDFLSGLVLVAHSDLMLTIPTDLAEAARELFAVTVRPCPVALDPVTLHLCWHRSRDQDEGIIWLRGLFEGLVR